MTNKFSLPTIERPESFPTKEMSENLPTEQMLENLPKKAKLENLPQNPLLSNDSEMISLDTNASPIKTKNLQNKPGLQFLRNMPKMPTEMPSKLPISYDSKEQIPGDSKIKSIPTNTTSTKNSKVQSKEYSKKGHYCEVGNCFARTSREALKFFHVLRKELKIGQRKAWIDAIRTTKPLKWVSTKYILSMFCSILGRSI